MWWTVLGSMTFNLLDNVFFSPLIFFIWFSFAFCICCGTRKKSCNCLICTILNSSVCIKSMKISCSEKCNSIYQVIQIPWFSSLSTQLPNVQMSTLWVVKEAYYMDSALFKEFIQRIVHLHDTKKNRNKTEKKSSLESSIITNTWFANDHIHTLTLFLWMNEKEVKFHLQIHAADIF